MFTRRLKNEVWGRKKYVIGKKKFQDESMKRWGEILIVRLQAAWTYQLLRKLFLIIPVFEYIGNSSCDRGRPDTRSHLVLLYNLSIYLSILLYLRQNTIIAIFLSLPNSPSLTQFLSIPLIHFPNLLFSLSRQNSIHPLELIRNK